MPGFGQGGRTTTPRSETKGLGIAGLVCGIVGLFMLSLILGPLAILFGWLAMGRRWGGDWASIPVAAVALGIVDTVLALIWLSTASGTGVFG